MTKRRWRKNVGEGGDGEISPEEGSGTHKTSESQSSSVQMQSPRKKEEGGKKARVSPSCTDNAGVLRLISMRKATPGIDILWHQVPTTDLLLNARLKEEGRNKLLSQRAGAAEEAHGKSIVQRGKAGRERIPAHSHSENISGRGAKRHFNVFASTLTEQRWIKVKLLTRTLT